GGASSPTPSCSVGQWLKLVRHPEFSRCPVMHQRCSPQCPTDVAPGPSGDGGAGGGATRPYLGRPCTSASSPWEGCTEAVSPSMPGPGRNFWPGQRTGDGHPRRQRGG